jgi:hypothetical protein
LRDSVGAHLPQTGERHYNPYLSEQSPKGCISAAIPAAWASSNFAKQNCDQPLARRPRGFLDVTQAPSHSAALQCHGKPSSHSAVPIFLGSLYAVRPSSLLFYFNSYILFHYLFFIS